MPREELFQKIRDRMVKTFGLEEGQITGGASLVDDLRLDSLDLAELLVVLERETGKAIPESELSAIRTIDDVLDLVEKTQANVP
jgi:acyl carrier protein